MEKKIKQPCISVIIPVYNSVKWLPYALESVLIQTYQNWECIIVDDGSTDNISEIVSPHLKKDPRIKKIWQPHRGLAKARNTGIKNSSSDFIAFLDADDLWKKNKLEEQFLTFLQESEAGLCYCYFEEIDADNNIIVSWPELKDRYGYFENSINAKILTLGNKVTGSGSGVLVKKECFRKAGLFAEDMESSEDLDMWYRIALLYPLVVCKQVLVQIRRHPFSMQSENILRVFRNNLRFINKALAIAPPEHIKNFSRFKYKTYWNIFCVYCRRKDLKNSLKYWFICASKNIFLTLGNTMISILTGLRNYAIFLYKGKT